MLKGVPTRMFAVYFMSVTFGISGVLGSMCLKCDDVPLPSLCYEVTECGPNESCSMEEYVTSFGTVSFRLGCSSKQACHSNEVQRRDDILVCVECCDGDICNAKGCSKPGFSDQFGPVCYTCPLQLGYSTCNKISLCDQNELCGIRQLKKVGAPDNIFETKCFSSNDCNLDTSGLLPTGEFMSCCNSTLCNRDDPRNVSRGQTTTTTQKMTTPQPVTQSTAALPTFTKQPTLGCEDVNGEICQLSTCHVYTPTNYTQINCRKTCGFCGHGDVGSTTPPTAVTQPITSQIIASSTTHSASTMSSYATTTQIPLRPDAVYDLYCDDVSAGCNVQFDICHTPAYSDWTKTNCQKSCGYCFSNGAPIVG